MTQSLFESLENRQLLSATISLGKGTFYFNDIASAFSGGTGSSPTQSLTIKNTGDASLTLASGSLAVSGTNAGQFRFSGVTPPKTLAPGASTTVQLAYTASALGIQTANLTIKSNDPAHATSTVRLRGLGTAGLGGNLEPSLQRILDLYQIPVTVGDNNPNDTTFPVPPLTPNNEVGLQRMLKGGSGNVTVQLLGVFDNAKSPATRMGWYRSGTPDNRVQLVTLNSSADSQTVNPTVSGTTSFDPGSTEDFSLYTIFPAFTNRSSYSEDALNTWESNTANRRKIRFYPLKNSDGSTVANAYVFAAEDWNQAYDFNDVVGIIRNVKPAPSAPEIGLRNADGAPFFDRLVFNRIEHPDTVRTNVVHDSSTLTIRNTGSKTLNITSLVRSDSSKWKISTSGPLAIAPGASTNVALRFVGVGTGLNQTFNGSLTINSDDPDERTTTVQLSAWWQSYSEQTPTKQYTEPTLANVVSIFGYGTHVLNSGQTMNTHGKATPVGDEVLSAYWLRADGNEPVGVRQLAAFHRQNNFDSSGNPLSAASTVNYFAKGSSTTLTKIFTHNTNEGQSFLPHLTNSTTQYAVGTFTPSSSSTPFGFKVDNRFSDDALNPHTLDPGHAFRFFPAKDRAGHTIANTYIMAQDYTGLSYSNYDYQDNIYLVTNIKPAPASAATPAARPATTTLAAAPTKSTTSSSFVTAASSSSLLESVNL